jgi:hypothetical protein
MDAEKIKAVALQLTEIAATFNPGIAGSIAALINAGTELNTIIKDIKEQTEANRAEVWDTVRTDFADSLEDFRNIAAVHAEQD